MQYRTVSHSVHAAPNGQSSISYNTEHRVSQPVMQHQPGSQSVESRRKGEGTKGEGAKGEEGAKGGEGAKGERAKSGEMSTSEADQDAAACCVLRILAAPTAT